MIDKPLIIDLLALTQAYIYLSDRLAWLSILRAPWCGLILNDLKIIADNSLNSNILTTINQQTTLDKLSIDGQNRLKNVNSILLSFYQHRERKPFDELIRNLWLALGGPACLNDSNSLEHADHFFITLKKSLEEHNTLDIENIESSLQSALISEKNPNANAIQVMTIHKSKGLEFDYVFIPGCNKGSRNTDQPILRWMQNIRPNNDVELLLAPIKKIEDDHDPVYRYIKFVSECKEQHELKRLFYVAATRTKAKLFLFHVLNKDLLDNNKFSPAKNSFTDMLWPDIKNGMESSINIKNHVSTIQPYEKSLIQYRLASNWDNPIKNLSPPPATFSNFNLHEFSNQHTTKQAGQLLHEVMHNLVINNNTILSKLGDINNFTSLFKKHKVPLSQYSYYFSLINDSVSNITKDHIGQWITNPSHEASACELELFTIQNKKTIKIIIDRTFIDNEIRWIIDYKFHTSATTPTNIIKEYKPQLEKYANAFSLTENKTIQLGVYLPLTTKWVSWEYNPTHSKCVTVI